MRETIAGTRRSARLLRTALVLLVLLTACNSVRGCAESEFTLAAQSRVPRWFSLPTGVPRSEVTVVLVYYTAPIMGPPMAEVTLRSSRGETLNKVVATLSGEPQGLEPQSGSNRIPYPIYEVLTANGITEVIEHRRMEPMFYIHDDLEIRRKLAVDR